MHECLHQFRDALAMVAAWWSVLSSHLKEVLKFLRDWPWTTPLVACAVCAVLVFALAREHRRWRQGWLSQLIDQKLAAGKQSNWSVVASWLGHLKHPSTYIPAAHKTLARFVDASREGLPAARTYYFPSLASFIVVSVAVVLSFVLPEPRRFWSLVSGGPNAWGHAISRLSSENSGKLPDLIFGAFTGLVAVAVALIIFVAESIRDDGDRDRKRVLLKTSLLGITIILELFLAAIMLGAIARVMQNLLDPDRLEKSRTQFLRERIRSRISASLRERVGNNLLLGESRIDGLAYAYSRLSIGGKASEYILFDAPTEGRLVDIHLDGLTRIIGKLDRYSRAALAFGIRGEGPKVEAAQGDAALAFRPPQRLQSRSIYLLKRIGESSAPRSIFNPVAHAVLAIPAEFGKNPTLVSEIRATVPTIFLFSANDDPGAAFRRELESTKDQLAAAIRSRSTGRIEELRGVYLSVAVEFLSLLKKYGGGYSAEQAKQERQTLFAGWLEVGWLRDDFRELIGVAFEEGNLDIITTISYLPFAVAARALEAMDHFLFQEFTGFSTFIYASAAEAPPERRRVRCVMMERSWRYPRDIAELYIASALEDRDAPDAQLESMKQFALHILRVLQDLLKLVSDKNDVGMFGTIAAEVSKLFERFRDDNRRPALVEAAGERSRSKIAGQLDLSVQLVLLAIAGRILARRLKLDAEAEPLLNAIRLYLPTSIQQLTRVFAEASDFRVSSYWGWDYWNLEPDGKAHWIDNHTELNSIYVVQGLSILAAMNAVEKQNVVLPHNHSLAEMARADNGQSVLVIIADIEEHPERWNHVLSEEQRAEVQTLKRLLSAARSAEQRAQQERERNATLDEARLAEFRSTAIQSFKESIRLRKIFKIKDAFVDKTREPPTREGRALGYNQIDDKGPYIAQQHISYVDWGRAFGDGLGRSESEQGFRLLVESAQVVTDVTARRLLGTICEAARAFRDPLVLQSLRFEVEDTAIYQSPLFVPRLDQRARESGFVDIEGFMGLIACDGLLIPLFNAFVRGDEAGGEVLLVDVRRFARWTQFNPAEKAEDQAYVADDLFIRVTDLNVDEERRASIVAQNLPWVAEEGEQDSVLRGKVLVNIFEKFSIDVLESDAVRRFHVRAGD